MAIKFRSKPHMFPLLAALMIILIAGCSKNREEVHKIKSELEKMGVDSIDIYHGLIPYDQPVWAVSAIFSRETMMETVRIRTESLYRMFQKTEENHPGLMGNMTVHFFVNPDGNVSDVEIVESNWNKSYGNTMEDSILFHLQKWTFPPGASKPIGVTQPWVFKPQ